MLLTDWARAYLLEREISAKYANELAYAVDRFSRWLHREATLDDFTDERINRYLIDRSDGVSRWTVRGERVKLLSLWRAAWQSELVSLPPRRVRKITIPRAAPRAWSLVEMRQLLRAADSVQGDFRRNRVPLRRAAYWRAVVLVGYSTALRLGDLEQLKFDDVEPDGTLIVTQRKTGAPIRCCLLPEAHASVRAIAIPKRILIFGGVLSRRSYYEQFGDIVKAAGLTGTTRWLRRTSGTLVETLAPGRGHEALGNGRQVFERHYLDTRQLVPSRPLPPSLVP